MSLLLEGEPSHPTTMEERYAHAPVMPAEVVENLVTNRDGLYLDATVGLGGHAEAMLHTLSAQGKLLGMDADPEALELAKQRLKPYAGKARLVHENFRNLGQTLETERFFPLAGALFDLGVSSLQFDKPARGFSLQSDGPLDMRLDPAGNPLTAARILNEWPKEQLAMLFKEFGEEKQAARIARWIIERRAGKPLETTLELARLIESRLGRRPGDSHPATRTFMALRIAVNRELENLTRGMEAILPFIASGGRVAVITFHSLEDRIVKHLFNAFIAQGDCRAITRSPLRPTPAEVALNPRSRSAKLRVVEKQ